MKRERNWNSRPSVILKKAYDLINRSILWDKLTSSKVSINGKMIVAVKSLCTNVSSSIRINGFYTDTFDVHCGLRQGCTLSSVLF